MCCESLRKEDYLLNLRDSDLKTGQGDHEASRTANNPVDGGGAVAAVGSGAGKSRQWKYTRELARAKRTIAGGAQGVGSPVR